MRPIGFSTGALGFADFRRGLLLATKASRAAIELSALRQTEWFPMLDSLKDLDLSGFGYVSIHAPSQFPKEWEPQLVSSLREAQSWLRHPIVVHPDAMSDFDSWRQLGEQVCIENMDTRKPIGRSAEELSRIFELVPGASLCFDIGHARQYDSTMTEAYLILRQFGSRLRQVHLSEVNTRSKHDVLSVVSIAAYREVAHMIPENIPVILESPVAETEMEREIEKARKALPIGVPSGSILDSGHELAWSF